MSETRDTQPDAITGERLEAAGFVRVGREYFEIEREEPWKRLDVTRLDLLDGKPWTLDGDAESGRPMVRLRPTTMAEVYQAAAIIGIELSGTPAAPAAERELEAMKADYAAMKRLMDDWHPTVESDEQPTGDKMIDRLRGIYVLPVNDGCGPLDGSDTFTRQFAVGSLNREAADRIAALESDLASIREEANKRLCGSCLEQHPLGTMCPPHECRTTGQAWFREQLTRRDEEATALREQNAKLQAVIASTCESEEEARKLAATVLPAAKVEGDGCGVPGIADVVEMLVKQNAALEQQLAAATARLAEIDAGAQADADDLAKMRDGTKLTRAGVVQIIVYQQQDIAELRQQLAAARGEREKLLEAFRLARMTVAEYAALHPKHYFRGTLQDPAGSHAALEAIDAALPEQPQ